MSATVSAAKSQTQDFLVRKGRGFGVAAAIGSLVLQRDLRAVKQHRDTTTLPPLFRRHVVRPRLTRILDESTAQAILLVAPAGYGKSTLAREWLQGKRDTVWYQATSASADLAAFSAGLADVLAPLVPRAGDRLKQRLRVGEAPEKAVRPLAELLGEDLAQWPEGARLVIDDYHHVMESAPVEEFMDWLLTLAPVRLLVSSRRRPRWASARRVLYGEVIEIGSDQLAMNDEEAGHVLSDRSSEAVRTLVREAEGWPALIGLASLSATLELPGEKVADALVRYFAEEVLRREPSHVQRFMLLASVPASINARIARDVLGFQEPDAILEQLRAEDLLHDAGGEELRFHPLLRDFLRRRIEGAEPELSRSISERLLAVLSLLERWDEAFLLAIELSKDQQAAEIFASCAPQLLASGRVETLEKWFDACGAAIFDNPSASLAGVELLLYRGRISQAVALAREIASGIPEYEPVASRAWNLAGRSLHLVSEDQEAFSSHVNAKRLANTESDLTDALWGLFVTANEIDSENSSSYLDELERVATDLDSRLRLAVGRQAAAEQRGSLAGLWPRYEALAEMVDRAQDPMIQTSFLANSAAVNVGRGHYDMAFNLAQRALSIARELRLEFPAGACLAHRAAAEIGLRRLGDARRTLTSFAGSSTRREDPYFRVMELTLLIKFAIARNDIRAAVDTSARLPSGSLPPRALGEYLATLSVARAAAGDCEAARRDAKRARELTGSVEARYLGRLADLLVETMDNGTSTATTKAWSSLIYSIAEDEFFDGLVVAYRAFPRLLLELAPLTSCVPILRGALERANDHRLAKGAGIDTTPNSSAMEGLTQRETEVLELLTQGLSNAQIARGLFISESTAKVHVHHVLSKLGVKTRVQAALRGAELLSEAKG